MKFALALAVCAAGVVPPPKTSIHFASTADEQVAAVASGKRRCQGANVILVSGFHHSGTTIVQHSLLRWLGAKLTQRAAEEWPDAADPDVRCSRRIRVYKHPTDDARRVDAMLALRRRLPLMTIVFVVRDAPSTAWSFLRRINMTARADIARLVLRQRCTVMQRWQRRAQPRPGLEWTLSLAELASAPADVAARVVCAAAAAGREGGEQGGEDDVPGPADDPVELAPPRRTRLEREVVMAQKRSLPAHTRRRERQALEEVGPVDPSAFAREASPAMGRLLRAQSCDQCAHPPCGEASVWQLPPCKPSAASGHAPVDGGRARRSADVPTGGSSDGGASAVRVLAIATDPTSCAAVRFQTFAAAAALTVDVHVPRDGGSYECTRPGACKHGAKVQALLEALGSLRASELVVYIDSYDAIVVAPPDEHGPTAFRSRFDDVLARAGHSEGVVLAAEDNLYVDFGRAPSMRRLARRATAVLTNRSSNPRKPFRFVNSGGLMGTAGSLRALLRGALATYGRAWNGHSDQALLVAAYALGLPAAHKVPPLVLDSQQRIFGTAARVMSYPRDVTIAPTGGLVNLVTGGTPLVYHVPGPKARGYECDLDRLSRRGMRVPQGLLGPEPDAASSGANGSAPLPLTCHAPAFCRGAIRSPRAFCGWPCKLPSPPLLVVYNRVSKAGSTSLIDIIGRLGRRHGHRLQRGSSAEWLSGPYGAEDLESEGTTAATRAAGLSAVSRMRHRLREYVRNARVGGSRTLFEQHMPHVLPYAVPTDRVAYINIVREPIARAVSFFYYTLYGADRPAEARAAALRTIGFGNATLSDCIGPSARRGAPAACAVALARPQLEYFCRPSATPRPQGGWVARAASQPDARALGDMRGCSVDAALGNVRSAYTVVGLLERWEETLALLERLLPSFFRGATRVGAQTAPRRVTRTQSAYVRPDPATLARLGELYAADAGFYSEVAAHFGRQVAAHLPASAAPQRLARSGGAHSPAPFTVVINTFRRDLALRTLLSRYIACDGVGAVHVVWNDHLRAYPGWLEGLASAHRPRLSLLRPPSPNLTNRFALPRFSPGDTAVLSIDDDVLYTCDAIGAAHDAFLTASRAAGGGSGGGGGGGSSSGDARAMAGFAARSIKLSGALPAYHWREACQTGAYNTILVTKGGFVHPQLYADYMGPRWEGIRRLVDELNTGEDLLMSAVHFARAGAKGRVLAVRVPGFGPKWSFACTHVATNGSRTTHYKEIQRNVQKLGDRSAGAPAASKRFGTPGVGSERMKVMRAIRRELGAQAARRWDSADARRTGWWDWAEGRGRAAVRTGRDRQRAPCCV